jgi:protein AbiQ
MNLSFYHADPAYCDFLRKADPRVPYISGNKERRPFVGVLIQIGEMGYFAPLTSPKPKHRTMKNQLDFFKIDGGKLGAINFNNMIPIHPQCLIQVEYELVPGDTTLDAEYKNLIKDQKSWCDANKARILKMAQNLYRAITSGTPHPRLSARCCDFPACERQYRLYCESSGLSGSGSEE